MNFTTYKQGGMRYDYFRSMDAFLKEVHPDALLKELNRGGDAYNHRSPAWTGAATYRQAWDIASTGMSVPPHVFEIREELTKRVRIARTEVTHWDVSGSSVDVGAYNTGVPECMLEFNEGASRSRKTVSLCLTVGARCDSTVQSLQLRGAAYMSLVDALELSGQYQVAVYATVGLNNRWAGVVNAKECGRPYDPQSLGYALGHPAMLRRTMFAYQDLVAKRDNEYRFVDIDHAYGSPCAVPSLPLEIDDQGTVDLTRVLNANIDTVADAIRWVSAQLESFNILDKEGLA